MRSALRLNGFVLVGICAWTWAAPAQAEPNLVAIQKIRAKKSSGSSDIIEGVKSALESADRQVKIVGSRTEAESVGAEQFVSLRLRYRKKRWQLQVSVVAIGSGESLLSTKVSYRKKGEASGVGEKVGEQVVAALPAVSEPEPEPEPVPIAPPPPAPTEPEPSPATEVKAEVTSSAEPPPTVVLRVNAGTQMMSNYTVSVDGEATSLAYRLSPLLLISPGVRIRIPSTPLLIDLQADFAPVSFDVSGVQGANGGGLVPGDPGGLFLHLGGDLALHFDLGERFGIEPLVGFHYQSMGVDEQVEDLGDGTEAPSDAVLSYSAIELPIGARVSFHAGDSFEAGLDARFRLLLGYSESPFQTGESGLGLGFGAGLELIYWPTSIVGVDMRLGYQYASVGMSGPGTRPSFENEPSLVDASVQYEDLRISAGVVIGM